MPDMFIPYETPYCDEEDGCAGGGGGGTVPTGGTTGQVLTKASNADFDTAWQTPSGGGGGGGAEFIVASSLYSPAMWVAKAAYVCDGTADDVEVNQALADAATVGGAGVGGGTVLLAPGFYFITADITVDDNVTLTGDPSSTLSTFLALVGVAVLGPSGSNTNNGLKHMNVIGYTAVPATGPFIDFSSTGSSRIEDLKIFTAGVNTDTSVGQYWMDVNMKEGGYVRKLHLDQEADFPLAASPADALVRISGAYGAIENIKDEVSNAGNVSSSSDAYYTMAISTGSSFIKGILCNGGGSISVGGQNVDVSNINVNGPNGNGIEFFGLSSTIHDCQVAFAGNAVPGAYDGIIINGTVNQVHHNNVNNGSNLNFGLHINAATDTTVTDNFLVCGASGANYQDDGTTTRSANNFVV